MRFFFAIVLALMAGRAHAIDIDGRLDEPEWAQARTFEDFRIVDPLTREQPPYRTRLQVLPLPDALYVSLWIEHPRAARTRGRSARDADSLDADVAQIVIDFEGQGRSAYEFAVSLSGSMRDSVVLNQTDFVRDWDAVWYAAVSEDETAWTVELEIPWSIAPAGETTGETRTIGVWASRYAKKTGERYAFPAADVTIATFVQDFQRLQIPRYSRGLLDVYPYAAVTSDLLESSTRADAGIDIFWLPNPSHRLSATLNPDFGQVESDELVVNFSAIETFFTEKRPFFTEGQQLFDVRTTEEGRLVHTRRIGAAPDAGSETATDILGAFKYTGAHGAQEFGVFAALEDDSRDAEGRGYAVGRWMYKTPSLNTGYLMTFTDRPTLDREAHVHAIDFDWRLGPGLTLRAQGLGSWITEPDAATGRRQTTQGGGAWLDLQYVPGGRWQQYVKATYFNQDLNFNDLGYQERASLLDLESFTSWDKFDYSRDSRLAASSWELWWSAQRNDSGDRLRGFIAMSRFFKWRNGAQTYFTYRVEPAGIDDLLTQGNGLVRLPSQSRLRAIHIGPQGGRWRMTSEFTLFEEGVDGLAQELYLSSKWIVAEQLSLGLDLDFTHSDDWLAWRSDDGLASYRREQLYALLGLDWYPSSRQEIRLRLQWIGLTAAVDETYLVGADTRLVRDTRPGSDFSVSTLGVQLRYRYEFKPLSELFVVYSRGGDGSRMDDEGSFDRQWRRTWREKTAHQVLMKVRYRF